MGGALEIGEKPTECTSNIPKQDFDGHRPEARDEGSASREHTSASQEEEDVELASEPRSRARDKPRRAAPPPQLVPPSPIPIPRIILAQLVAALQSHRRPKRQLTGKRP